MYFALFLGHLVSHLLDVQTCQKNDGEILWYLAPKYDDQIYRIQQSSDAIEKNGWTNTGISFHSCW